jgi:hypothetical protein
MTHTKDEAMKRFLIDTSVENAEGSQTWYVDAKTEEEALAKFKSGDCNIYESNVEVTRSGEPEISGEVPLDDFGRFAEQPPSAPTVQDLPFGVGGGLVAIKTLLSRDPCVHANTAIEMIDAILKEYPAAQPAPCTWTKSADPHMPDTFHSTCGVVWTFTDGGPGENNVRFCPGCGGKLVEGQP